MPTLPTAPLAEHCHVVELRQYTLHPGCTDTLITLFDHEFVESQESVGMRVMGQFRDLERPDKFVWLRGYADMPSRAAGLQAFYGGPVWAAHRDAANATMIDSDDVLLLKPAWPGAALTTRERAPVGATQPAPGLLLALAFNLQAPAAPELVAHCQEMLAPQLRAAGALQQGWYVSEPSANNFPRLPVREGENVIACFALFGAERRPSDAALADCRQRIEAGLAPWQTKPPQCMLLAPTARSALHA